MVMFAVEIKACFPLLTDMRLYSHDNRVLATADDLVPLSGGSYRPALLYLDCCGCLLRSLLLGVDTIKACGH